MENRLAVIGAIFVATVAVFGIILVAPIIGALLGAFVGLVVGWAFPVTFHTFFSALGLGMLVPWQIGMMLGFVGSFFRTVNTNKYKIS